MDRVGGLWEAEVQANPDLTGRVGARKSVHLEPPDVEQGCERPF